MATREYRPGARWTLVARGHLAVLLPSEQALPLVPRLWDLLGDGTDLYGVLDALTSEFGFARLPAFGIAEHRERLRLLVRGAVDAAVTTAAGQERVSGADVGTWLERGVEGWTSVELLGEDDGGPALPLEGGAVGAASLRVHAVAGSSGPAASAVREPGPVATKEPAPEALREPAPEALREPAPAAAQEPAPAAAGEPVEATILPSAETQHPVSETQGSLGDSPLSDFPVTDSRSAEAAPEPGAPELGAPEPAVPEPAAPVEEHPTTSTSSYDQLWGSTVVRSVEDAAVRVGEGEDGEEAGKAADAGKAAESRQAAERDAPEADRGPQAPGRGRPGRLVPEQATDPLPPAQTTEPLGAGGWTPPGLLIDAVPWGRPATPTEQPAGHLAGNHPAPETGPEGRSITSELFGDHDGETVMRSDLDGLGGQPGGQADQADLGLTVPPPPADEAEGAGDRGDARSAPPSSSASGSGPLVLGRRCPRGHANPPSYAQCPACGEAIAGEPEQLPRPALGRVRLSSGEVIELEEPLVVGRQPSVSRVASGGMPRLVTVTSPSGDISRNHLEVRLEGWHVMLRDLKATNGTVLERPGQSPRRLAQGEMTIVLDGDVADLGDGVTLTFEAVP